MQRIFALCRKPHSTVVDAESMIGAIDLTRWFAREAERVYAMLIGDAASGELEDLATLIRDRGGAISSRELAHVKRKYRGKGAARDALLRLAEAGYGKIIDLPPGPKGGRPERVFRLSSGRNKDAPDEAGNGNKTRHGDGKNGSCATVTTITDQCQDGTPNCN